MKDIKSNVIIVGVVAAIVKSSLILLNTHFYEARLSVDSSLAPAFTQAINKLLNIRYFHSSRSSTVHPLFKSHQNEVRSDKTAITIKFVIAASFSTYVNSN